jgi:TPR repeat protein
MKRKGYSTGVKAQKAYLRAEEYWRRGRLRAAFRCFLAAARAGVAPAFETVAQFYYFGEGVKANEKAALQWYRRAARNGCSHAANNIGCILRDRGKVNRALKWFARAVDLGDDDAHLNIARIYLRQRPDSKRAIRHLGKVCRSQNVTEGSQEEALRLLKDLKSKKRPILS